MEKQSEKIRKRKAGTLTVATRYLSFFALVSTILFNSYYYLNLKNDIERRLDKQFELASSQVQLALIPQLKQQQSEGEYTILGDMIQPVFSSILASTSFDRLYLAFDQKKYIGLHREDVQKIHILSSMPFDHYRQRKLALHDKAVVSIQAFVDQEAQRKKLLLALMNSLMLSFLFYLLSVLMLFFFYKLFVSRKISRTNEEIERVDNEFEKDADELKTQMENQQQIYKAIKKNKGK